VLVDFFDAYINETGQNPPIPTFRIDMTMVVIATQTQVAEVWEYHVNQVWVTDRPEGRIEEGSDRKTFEYHLLAYGNKTVTIT
ncbi:unnamed protein product, partial [marine sediment metagenome]